MSWQTSDRRNQEDGAERERGLRESGEEIGKELSLPSGGIHESEGG